MACSYCGVDDGPITRKCRCNPCDCEEMKRVSLGCPNHEQTEEWDGGDERIEIKEDLKKLDELVLGEGWLHLERLSGTNSRYWCLIITNEKGEQLNITIHEKEGKINKAFILDNEWESK